MAPVTFSYIVIWVKISGMIYQSTIPSGKCIMPDGITWEVMKNRDFYFELLEYLGGAGWQLISVSVPDQYGVTRYIFCKRN